MSRLSLISIPISVLMAANALAQNLPSANTKQAIESIEQVEPQIDFETVRDPNFKSLTVQKSDLPQETQGQYTYSDTGKTEVPFVVPNTVILQFEKDATKEDIEAFLTERNMRVIKTFPNIGAMQVETDLSEYFQPPQIGDNSANDALARGLVNAIEGLQSDKRIKSAAPDLLLEKQEITNFIKPAEIFTSPSDATQETVDWGIADIEADKVWGEPGAEDGMIFGVMDIYRIHCI